MQRVSTSCMGCGRRSRGASARDRGRVTAGRLERAPDANLLGVRLRGSSNAEIASEREFAAVPRRASGDDAPIGRLDFDVEGVIPYRGEVRRHLAVAAAERGIRRAVAVVASDSELRVRAEEVGTA